jgi:hypothetical protein
MIGCDSQLALQRSQGRHCSGVAGSNLIAGVTDVGTLTITWASTECTVVRVCVRRDCRSGSLSVRHGETVALVASSSKLRPPEKVRESCVRRDTGDRSACRPRLPSARTGFHGIG